ncbi:MAG: hypothetical protein WAM42_06135, partial [Candidatus Nitrosopolaris sp.]
SRKKRIRDVGAGRPFKLKVKERFVMLLVYYRLYMTYTLTGFPFDFYDNTFGIIFIFIGVFAVASRV